MKVKRINKKVRKIMQLKLCNDVVFLSFNYRN